VFSVRIAIWWLNNRNAEITNSENTHATAYYMTTVNGRLPGATS